MADVIAIVKESPLVPMSTYPESTLIQIPAMLLESTQEIFHKRRMQESTETGKKPRKHVLGPM
ncbi:hypothetical protein CHS0354_024670, partial [Potamilus streckersoni]